MNGDCNAGLLAGGGADWRVGTAAKRDAAAAAQNSSVLGEAASNGGTVGGSAPNRGAAGGGAPELAEAADVTCGGALAAAEVGEAAGAAPDDGAEVGVCECPNEKEGVKAVCAAPG